MLTPGFNPNAPGPTTRPGILAGAPELSGVPPVAPVAPEIAPREAPMPEFNPRISRGEEYGGAKAEFMAKTPGRGKSALTGALQGFLRGGGLAGAATGAIYGAADPRGLREQEFNRTRRPQLLERFAMEDAETQARRQAEQDAINNQYRQAQIGELESQAYKNRQPPPAPRPLAPIHSDRGLYDPEARQIIPGTEPLPKEEKPPTPHWVRDESGNYVDLNAPKPAGKPARPVRGYDRPRAPKEPKAEARPKPGSKGEASKEDIDALHKKLGGHGSGWSIKGVKQMLKRKGYTVPE